MEIKRLLYEEKLTIEGARKRLKSLSKADSPDPEALLRDLKAELKEVVRLLE